MAEAERDRREEVRIMKQKKQKRPKHCGRDFTWIDKDEMLAEVQKFHDAHVRDLHDGTDTARCSDKLALMLSGMVGNMFLQRAFSCWMKTELGDDMRSEGIFICMKSLSRADPSRGAVLVYAYFNRCI